MKHVKCILWFAHEGKNLFFSNENNFQGGSGGQRCQNLLQLQHCLQANQV